MLINLTKLNGELQKAGIVTSGCNSDGKVWDDVGGEIQTRPDVMAVIAVHDPNPTPAELVAVARKNNARADAKAIPNWVSWSETDALTWLATNIGTPLDTPIPATITLTNIRPVLVNIVNVMKKQYALEQAQSRMLIALRDEIWPSLQDE
jgi:hypothetical protein